jgi:hypothetical protein
MSLIHVKCVLCGHRWDVSPVPTEMPMCPKCMGPVTVERSTFKSQQKRIAAQSTSGKKP